MEAADLQRLERGDGHVAWDISGSGPLVVCVPGWGDLRSSYRMIVPGIVAAGFRAVTMDLRGHGDSSATFGSYGDEATAGDIAALLEELEGPAVIIGNAMAAGSAVIVAARRPALVAGLVLIAPLVRNSRLAFVTALPSRALLATPWAGRVWRSNYARLNAGRRPEDFSAYVRAMRAAIGRPGFSRAFSLTTRTSHAPARSWLPEVACPTLVVMGELDRAFTAPIAEAAWVAEQTDATALLVAGAGHYPQSQRPDIVLPAVLRFLERAFGPAAV